MFKFSYKRLISILCSVLIIVSSFVSALTFAKAEAEVLFQGFEENFTYSGNGFSLYTANGANDNNVYAGSNSLKWTHKSNSNPISLYPGKDLVVGQSYKIELWIKAVTSTYAHIDITQLGAKSNGWAYDASLSIALPHFGTNYDSVGQWKKFEYTFVAQKNVMGLLIYGDDDFYFDNITWTPVKSEVTVDFVTNCETTTDPLKGAPGSAIPFPTLTNEGLEFAGWYTDAEFVTPFTDTNFPADDLTLYARWLPEGVIVQEFEKDYAYSGNGFSLYTATDATDENVYGGTKSLKWTHKSNSNPISLYPGKDLVVGETYRIEMWVKAVSSTYAHIDITQLNDVANGWSFSDNPKIELPHFGTNYDSVGQWKRFEYTFVATKKAMGLLVYGNDDFYIDNISWTPVKERVTVDIVTNNGETATPLTGAPGITMTLPVLTYEGFSFAGWYLDPQFKTPFTNITNYPLESTTIYAKWLPEGVVVQDFEVNYTYSGSGFSLYTATDATDTNVYDGTKSLKWTNKSSSNPISLYPGKELVVGETYRIEMWVKAESSTYAHIDITQLNDVANGWSFSDNPRIELPHFGTDYDSVGKWKKFTYVFVATKKAMGLLVYGEDDFYIDAITWTPLKQDITVNIVTNNGTEFTPLQGAAGMELKLPALTKDGYYFAGWFKNAEFTKPINSNVFPEESTTVYAKWIENGVITQNFESYDQTLSADSGFELYTATKANDEKVYEGEHSLYRNTFNKTRVATISDQYTTLTVGKAYKLTFKLKVVELGTGGGIEFTNLRVRDNPWSYSKNSSIKYIGVDYKNLNQWVDVSYIFIADSLYYGISSWGNIAYYADDFNLVEIPITTITFVTGEGEAKVPQSGAAGSSLSIENPVAPEGKAFAGWYLDAKYTKPFVVSVYPEANITLYARWITAGTYEQDFELWPGDGAFHTSPVFTLYTATDEKDPNVYSGSHSMLYTNEDKTSGTFALNIFDTTMGALQIGEKYNVSIRFKPVSTPYGKYDQKSTYHSIYNTTLQSNCWTYQSQGPLGQYRSIVFYQTSFSDESWTGTGNAVTTTTEKDANGWLTMNYEITASTPYIALYMTGLYKMFVDYITIIPLESGVVAEDYSMPYAEDYYNLLSQKGITDSPNQTNKTIHKLDVSPRSDYVFTALLKKGVKGNAKVYLAWDEKGKNKIEGTEFIGSTTTAKMYSSRIITDFVNAVYLVVEGGGAGSSSYFAFFPTKFAFEEDPNPYFVNPKVNYDKLESRPADQLLLPYNKLAF